MRGLIRRLEASDLITPRDLRPAQLALVAPTCLGEWLHGLPWVSSLHFRVLSFRAPLGAGCRFAPAGFVFRMLFEWPLEPRNAWHRCSSPSCQP